MLSNDNKKARKQSNISLRATDSRASSAPHANNDNMFLFDVGDYNPFTLKKKEQTDEEFKETWDKLKNTKLPPIKGSIENHISESFSIKEEIMLGNDFLGDINSPYKSRRKESNLSSIYSDEEISAKKRRISTGSISKMLKIHLDNKDDKEIILAEFYEYRRKLSIKKNNGLSINNNVYENSQTLSDQVKLDINSDQPLQVNENIDVKQCKPIDDEKANISHNYSLPKVKEIFNSNQKNININDDHHDEHNNYHTKDFKSNDSRENHLILEDNFKGKSEPMIRPNFIPKDQLYKNTPNTSFNHHHSGILQNQSGNVMNNFQYYEGLTSNNMNNNFKNINTNFSCKDMNNNYSYLNYPIYHPNSLNNFYDRGNIPSFNLHQPRINNNIIYNNRQLNTIYNNSTPTMNNISNLNISVPSYNTNPQSKSGNYTSSNNKQTKQFQKNIGFNYSEMDTFQLINNIEIIGKDQTGCRFLQRKIQDDKNFLNNFLYPKIISNILDFMNDNFGNYLIQKIIEDVCYERKKEILLIIQQNFLILGVSPHGTRVVQKIIESVFNFPDLIAIFISVFDANMISLIKDVNGNHIIIKFVNIYKSPVNDFIYRLLNDHIVEISTDKHGCCVIQKCIEAANNDQQRTLVSTIIKNTFNFILNQYANYVLQFIVIMVVEIIKNNLDYLSKQRFSSNVIEKCFDYLNPEYQVLLIKEISKQEVIASLLFNMYGNYVLQKALQMSSEPFFSIILTNIAKHMDQLKTYSSFGGKLYIKLLTTYPVLNNIRNSLMNSNDISIISQNCIEPINHSLDSSIFFNNSVYINNNQNNYNNQVNNVNNHLRNPVGINKKASRKNMH